MTGRFLDRDPLSGAVETFRFDEATAIASIHRSADVEPVIDANKEATNHGTIERRGEDDGDLILAARIPMDVALIWLQRYGVMAWKRAHWDKVRRLLNDGEWRYLKVRNIII